MGLFLIIGVPIVLIVIAASLYYRCSEPPLGPTDSERAFLGGEWR